MHAMRGCTRVPDPMVTPTWDSETHPKRMQRGVTGWIRTILRGVPLAIFVFGSLVIFLCVRLLERLVSKTKYPITPHITVFVCRTALKFLGIPIHVHGTPMSEGGGLVANHASWLDIFVLNSVQPLYFVSKAEVAKWPGIGWLARATNTVFIARDARQSKIQKEQLQERLAHGHKLLFFPEGTSSDGLQVLPFKSSLFAAYLDNDTKSHGHMQAISVVYHAPNGQDPRFYGWWGDMGFAEHLIDTLAAPKQGHIDVLCHPPIALSDFTNRKALAHALETLTRDGHNQIMQSEKSDLP